MNDRARFRLATLLRLREVARDRRRVELAESRREDDELAAQLESVQDERERLQEEGRRAASPGALDVRRLVEAQRYDAALRTRQSDLQEQRRTLAAEIERRRESLVTADRDVRVLEKLRERHEERQRQERERTSAKQLDEAALQAVGR